MNVVVGANEENYHYKNFNFERDLGELAKRVEVVDIAVVKEGDPCPVTGNPLIIKRGIEIGNIFQLGTKYSERMNCSYLDKNGKSQFMIMGCYGIGLGRIMAAIIEQSHDKFGPIWPFSISPYHVHICALDIKKDAVKHVAEQLYSDLAESGIEVLYDDRGEKAGFMFNDADLIGIPLRIIVSPKTVCQEQVEFKNRDGSRSELVAIDEVKSFIIDEIERQSKAADY